MSEPRPGLGPRNTGSKRAQMLLAMAQAGASGKLRTPDSQPIITFARRKRPPASDEAQSVIASMQATPKKHRTVQHAPAHAAGEDGDASAGAAGPAHFEPAAARFRSVTCTHLADCYSDAASRQALRQARLEAEEGRRRRAPLGSWAPRGGGGGGLPRLPAGMVNLGNTCYLNAVLQASGRPGSEHCTACHVAPPKADQPPAPLALDKSCFGFLFLQVLLSLPSFVADLRQGAGALAAVGQPLSAAGVYSALLDCVAAKEGLPGGRTHITPASLKRALDAASAAFQGTFQQDAHELLCSLLDTVQGEVLAREAARLGRTRVRASETADPAARNFGFAVQHELCCRRCGQASRVVEQYTHLSLELPAVQPGSGIAPPSIPALLRDYFAEEQVEKSCEVCGGGNQPHSLCHTVRRLPRILCLHLKRFKISWDAAQQQAVCQKLHTSVEMPEAVRLKAYMAPAAAPPLPGGLTLEAGKENEQQQANSQTGGLPGSQEEGPMLAATAAPPRPDGQLERRSGVAFYGGSAGGAGGTPVAAHALLSPRSGTPGFLARRRPGTPGAGAALKGCRSLADREDEELRQALALSMLEQAPGQPLQQPNGEAEPCGGQQPAASERQGWHQPWGPQALSVATCPRRRAAEGEEAPAEAAPLGATEAAELRQPPEAEEACPAGLGAQAGGSHRLEDQWFMGLGRSSSGGGGDASGAGGGGVPGAATQQEEEELRRAIQLSILEVGQPGPAAAAAGADGDMPVACGASGAAGGGESTPLAGLIVLGAAAAGLDVEEDADLQRALQLSLLDSGGGGSQPAAARTAAPAAVHPGADWHGKEQQQGAREAAGAGSRQQDGLPGVDALVEVPTGCEPAAADGGVAAGTPAPARMHAQIVEDDQLLSEGEQQQQQQGGEAAAAAAGGKSPPAHYRLHAVVGHVGAAASCGHFTADVCDSNSRAWHRYDDSRTSRIGAGEARGAARQRECYLLFYVAAAP